MSSKNAEGLNVRQAAFVEAYAENGGNGTQAAVAAGYTIDTAPVTASKLLRNANVAAAIERRREKVREVAATRLEVTKEDIMRGLLRIALDNAKNDGARVQAYKLLGQEIGMFVQRHHVLHDDVARLVEKIADERGFTPEQRKRFKLLSERITE